MQQFNPHSRWEARGGKRVKGEGKGTQKETTQKKKAKHRGGGETGNVCGRGK